MSTTTRPPFWSTLLNLPIRLKLFYCYSMAFLVYILVGNLVIHAMVATIIENNIEEQLDSNTSAILTLVRTSADTAIRNYLRAVAEKNLEIVEHFHGQSVQGELSEEQARAEAARVLLGQTIGNTGYIYVIDSNGVIQVHPSGQLLGRDISDFDFIRQQMLRKEGYIEYDWANPGESLPRPKALYMTSFAPWDWIISASSYREEFTDLIDTADFRDSILETVFGTTGYSYVMDSSGTLIIHPAMENENIFNSTDSDGRMFIQEICEKKSGHIIYPWQNPGEPEPRHKLVVFNYIPELDWIVASSSYLEEFYAPLDTVTYTTLALGAGMLLLLLPVTWFIGAAIARPLNTLMQAFQDGAKGDLTRRMDINKEPGKDELQQLAVYYNTFMDKLESSQGRLRLSEEQYRTLFEHAVEGVFQATVQGRIIRTNSAMARLFGYDSPQAFMAEVNDITYDLYTEPQERNRLLSRLRDDQYVRGFEVNFRRKNGEVFRGVINARALFNDSGELALIEGMVHDVTSQFETQVALIKAKENAEAASRLKTDFLSMISHEMRTPLTSVIGYAKLGIKKIRRLSGADPLVLDEKGASTLAFVQDGLEIMAQEGARLAKLIEDLLDLTDLEGGKAAFVMEPVDPHALAQALLPLFRDLAEAKGLGFNHDLEHGLPLVQGDKQRLEQVLIALVQNAAKFTDTGTITLWALHRGDRVEFGVRDTGPGIPPEYLEQLFERFFQIGEVLTGKPHGSGLGLAICRLIVEAHGGRIWVESTPGRGSAFMFTVPVSTAFVEK
ncbi:MAG: PAS domain S-box protein [Desulfovibrio sp.]|nr:MAG: PAS domain S-box protein [Desulfovibrio sp.]